MNPYSVIITLNKEKFKERKRQIWFKACSSPVNVTCIMFPSLLFGYLALLFVYFLSLILFFYILESDLLLFLLFYILYFPSESSHYHCNSYGPNSLGKNLWSPHYMSISLPIRWYTALYIWHLAMWVHDVCKWDVELKIENEERINICLRPFF